MRTHLPAAVGLAAAACLVTPALSGAAPGSGPDLTPGQQEALDLGIQVAPKGGVASLAAGAVTPNPWLANLPDVTDADYFTWNKQMHEARGRARRLGQARRQPPCRGRRCCRRPFVHDEQEPAGTAGSNDTAANAEPIPAFGTAATKNPRVRILGALANIAGGTAAHDHHGRGPGLDPARHRHLINGSGAVRTDVRARRRPPRQRDRRRQQRLRLLQGQRRAGQSILANTEGTPTGLDTVLAVYAADGTPLAADDDGGTGVLSNLAYSPETPGDYYVLAAGYDFFGPLPNDPTDSGSGNGGADEGSYNLAISVQQVDRDFYSVRLRPG